ncbi:hypothetical protein BDR06DRAFT_976091 [Suillus hirtellus]|nr:hypothetical protein BDR06DRAFT_976091 [Suillus hirtellus]
MLDLLSKDQIVNEAGLRAALRHLDMISSSGATALQATVKHMSSSPYVFAYIISVWDRCEAMISQIMTDFPRKSQEYPTSVARTMLDNLSMYFLAFPDEPLAMDVARDISHHRGFIEDALHVLCKLNTMKFSGAGSFEDENNLSDESDDGFVKKKVPHKIREHNLPIAHTSIDASIFPRLDLVVPLTSEAAASLSTHILTKLKNTLLVSLCKFYLSLLRRTELAGDIKALLLPNVDESAKDVAPEVSSTEDVESPTTRPNAYQMVQFMKAVLYFENADGFGEWRILISTQAYKKLREFCRADKKIFKIIFKQIKHTHLRCQDDKGFMISNLATTDLFSQYQIDCVPDQDGKIYGIYMDAQLDRVWDALSSYLTRKGREYRSRCIFQNRPVLSKDSTILPASFPLSEHEPEFSASPLNLSDKDMDHVDLEKYFTFSQAFLHSLIADQDVQHVFMLIPQEQKIVECTTSCYILGRRGTGKTTTMLFKILGIQRAWQTSAVDMPKPRQIFVTKYRVLATRAKECFTKFLELLALADYTLEELAKMKAQSVQEGLVDLDDLSKSQMNIPMKYSKLEDEHFPLFVTFDRLAQMIVADISDPWLVFSEIMGIVQGSEHGLTCPEGVLDRPNYTRLSHCSYPNFANQRGILYDIFEYYTKIKRQRRHHDAADRYDLLHLVTHVMSQYVPKQYVDDVQDILLIDALFLKRLCRNSNSLFWAGDTAQTISAGSSFRSADSDSARACINILKQQQDISVNSAGACLRQPAIFQLAINYTSHGGIVNCASSVIELITKFWPNTVDNLRPEKGVVDGLKPVFFTGWDKNTVHHEQFWFWMRCGRIEFGAEQCILVRDGAARQKLRDEVGEVGLIMMLYESKGLEFDDICHDDGQGYAPNFNRDEAQYAGVCSELFWTSRNQVQNCTPSTDVPHLAVSSTPEEWASFGRSLFSHKRYLQAIHCFERANLRREVKVCEAYQLRDVARSSVGVALLCDQKRAFNVAADAFTDCGATTTGNQKLQYYCNSVDCYVRAGDDLKAAEAYFNAQEFEQVARRYRKVGRFDRNLHVLNDHGMDIPEEPTTKLCVVCEQSYCSRNNTQPPLPLFLTFDEEVDEELESLEDYDLDDARTSLLESHSRYYEAAELHLSENRPLEAVQAFMKDESNIDSTIHAADTILEYFWRRCSFRITVESIADKPMQHFIALANQLEMNKLTPATRDQISMFQSILRGNHKLLRNLALGFHEQNNEPAALLCLDHIFSRTTDIRTFAVDEMQWGIQRLFSIVRLSSDQFLIPDGTFLHNNLMEICQGIILVSEHPSGYTASHRVVTQLLQQSIRTILKDKILEIDVMCCKSPVFSQCLQFLISGVCRRYNCPQEHVAVSKLDRQYYNNRVAIHIWQILILQFMYSAHPYIEQRDSMRDWLKHLYEAINPPFFIQGTPVDLDMNLMPLHLDGMKVVKLWIRKSFYSLDPSHTQAEFLTALMGITSLSFAFDRDNAPVYISRANCMISGPLELFRKGDNRYMVHDLLNSYQGATCSSISSGILYIIWLLFPHKFTTEKETKLFLMGKLLDEIARLVEALRVEAGMDFLWLNHARFTPILHNVFISRICRVLCLIVHNIRNRFLRHKVDNIILSLHDNNTPLNWHLANYRKPVDDVVRYMTPLPGQAPPSDVYLRALLAFDDNKGVGNLVHLVHKTMNQYTRVNTSIGRRLVYEKTIEIPHLLSSYAVVTQSTPRVEALASVPRLGHSKDQPDIMQHEQKEITEPRPQEFEGEGEGEREGDLTANADTETRDASETLDEAAVLFAPDLDESLRTNGPSAEEEEAARKIQNAYRCYVRRRSSCAVNPEIDAIFMTCLKETQSPGWYPGYYSLLFLGPLPHLLVCLERGIALAHAAKAKTEGLFHAESHEKLEELGKQRIRIAKFLRKGLKLRKQLEPSSSAHRARDIDALRSGVLEVEEFMQGVPSSMKDMQSDFQMAYKGIVAKKVVESQDCHFVGASFCDRVALGLQAITLQPSTIVTPLKSCHALWPGSARRDIRYPSRIVDTARFAVHHHWALSSDVLGFTAIDQKYTVLPS